MSGTQTWNDATASSLRRRLVAWLVAGAYFMELLDGTVIATALPQIARSFHVNAVALNLGMTAYLLTLGVFIPISGWIADRFGARSVFGCAIALFTFSSVLCGLSTGLWTFTGARVLQGIGGAMMVPVGRLVVLRTTAKADLMRVMALIVWPGLLAPVVGPAVGGFITTYFSWPWIFFLNVPLGILAFALNFRLVPNLQPGVSRRLDFVGFVLSGVAVVALVYGLDAFGEERSSDWAAAGFVLLGAAASALALWHFRRVTAPLLEFSAMRRRTFSVFIWGGSLFRITISTAPFLLPLMFQLTFGMNALDSGLLVMAVFVGNVVIKPATTTLLRAFGFRNILLFNGLVVAVTLAACGLFYPSTSRALIVIVLFVGGAARSLQYTAMGTLQFAEVPPAEMSGANTLSSMAQQVTSGVGVAAGALAINLCVWARGARFAAPQLADFHNAFFLIGAASLLSTFDWLGLAKDAGAIISGRGAAQPAVSPANEKTG
jgi:EmrB/QacA subfamily drug resistance transporter